MSSILKQKRMAMAFFVGTICVGDSVLVEGGQIKNSLSFSTYMCDPSGECVVDFSGSASAVVQMCESPKASIMWNAKRKDAFLVACDCECTSHDNTGWLLDKDVISSAYNIQRLSLGKKSTIEALEQKKTKIRDVFSSYPLCEVIDFEKLKVSFFVTLIKRPTNDELTPYCFYPAYIVEGQEGLEPQTNNADDEYGKLLRMERDDSLPDAELLNLIDATSRFREVEGFVY